MKRILAYYAIGQMPPPGNVKGREVKSETALAGLLKLAPSQTPCDVPISLLAGLTSRLRTRGSQQVEILAFRQG